MSKNRCQIRVILRATSSTQRDATFLNPNNSIDFSIGLKFDVLQMAPSFSADTNSQRTEGRLNLNFQAHLYGVALLNPWNMSKYAMKTLNSKIYFKALNRAIVLSLFDQNFAQNSTRNSKIMVLKILVKKWQKNCSVQGLEINFWIQCS